MNAHQLDADGVILNTIVVNSLDVFPNLVDASIGGVAGDRIVAGAVVPAAPPPVDLPALRARLVANVDDHIAAITTRWTRFETEYVEREAAARAFAAAGYVGDPGIWVTGFAVPAGLSNTAAANLIISQADGLRTALELLGAQRMAKYNIVSAGTAATAQAAHDAIIAQANIIAAAL